MNWCDQQFDADIWRRDLAESFNLVRRRRHAHLQDGDVELVGRTPFRHHLQDGERKAETVVVVALALENAPSRSAQQMRRQLFGRRLARAPSDSDNWPRPCLINFVRQRLQRGDGIFDEQQPVAHRLQLRIIPHTISARDSRDCVALERLRNKSVRVCERAVETGACVIFLRQREEEFARAGRPRVNRESNYFIVKQLCA